jgi:hypothetical protein
MKVYRFFFLFFLLIATIGNAQDVIIIKPGIIDDRLSPEWKEALITRMPKEAIDSFGAIRRKLTVEELAWQRLIASKLPAWNQYRDSLDAPFPSQTLHDTIYVMPGYLGNDDGFTFGPQIVCIDLTALYRAYGAATLEENDSRIDRIFAHEYTHLLHKAWARDNKPELRTFKDSILWECLYEGLGMYRSLNQRWLPVNGILPAATTKVLEELYPVFTERMIRIHTAKDLSAMEKESLNTNLSRGPVQKKWGAFTVAIWLVLETGGDPQKLAECINAGPATVIRLAKKYLPKSASLPFTQRLALRAQREIYIKFNNGITANQTR